MELRGCGTALVTPFHPDTTIDVKALAALVEWQIASGIQFLVACGTTAETPSLTDREALDVVRIVVRVAAGRVPVVAGCTHNATREAVERAKAVAAVLKLGLANPSRVDIEGKGPDVPIASNSTPDGRARNRRVEIFIERSE
jgi:hypothetical protein